MIEIRDAARHDASLLVAYLGKKSELDRATGVRGIAFYERAGATIVARDDEQVTFRIAL